MTSQVLVSTRLKASPARAFEIFTRDIALWWTPNALFRFTPRSPGTLAFEPHEGGRFTETLANGIVFEIGRIRVWEPGRTAFVSRGVVPRTTLCFDCLKRPASSRFSKKVVTQKLDGRRRFEIQEKRITGIALKKGAFSMSAQDRNDTPVAARTAGGREVIFVLRSTKRIPFNARVGWVTVGGDR